MADAIRPQAVSGSAAQIARIRLSLLPPCEAIVDWDRLHLRASAVLVTRFVRRLAWRGCGLLALVGLPTAAAPPAWRVPAPALLAPLAIASAMRQPAIKVVGQPDRKSQHHQSWICMSAGWKHRSSGDIKVLHSENPAITVDHSGAVA